jgi:hypothetical protein
MMFQNLILQASRSTPQVVFEINGNLLIKGRSFILDPVLFYQPLIDWVNQLHCITVKIDIDIDYFNSASSKNLLEILKNIDTNIFVHEFTVIWNFESDDEEILELGKIYEEKLKKARFFFKEYAES